MGVKGEGGGGRGIKNLIFVKGDRSNRNIEHVKQETQSDPEAAVGTGVQGGWFTEKCLKMCMGK